MICPKCQHPMHTFSRSGMQVEQCSGCRGVFLDYGELEHLVKAEGQYYNRPAPPAPPVGYQQQPTHIVHSSHGHRPHRSHYGHHHSFLGEIFG